MRSSCCRKSSRRRRTSRAAPTDARSHRLHVMAADARRFVRASRERYDVIVADNFHPARSGSGSLYTVEHFRAVRARLAADGVFCQWLPLHQLDLDTLRSIVRSFIAVYPRGYGDARDEQPGHTGDRAGRAPRRRSDSISQQIRARLASAMSRAARRSSAIADELALLGTFIAGPRALATFRRRRAAQHRRPARSSRIALRASSTLRIRCRAIDCWSCCDKCRHRLRASCSRSTDTGWSSRLAAYWSARESFHRSRTRRATDRRCRADAGAGARTALLDVLRISPDFRPAYDPLLRMATALSDRDPAAARALLADLARVQPSITAAQ